MAWPQRIRSSRATRSNIGMRSPIDRAESTPPMLPTAFPAGVAVRDPAGVAQRAIPGEHGPVLMRRQMLVSGDHVAQRGAVIQHIVPTSQRRAPALLGEATQAEIATNQGAYWNSPMAACSSAGSSRNTRGA